MKTIDELSRAVSALKDATEKRNTLKYALEVLAQAVRDDQGNICMSKRLMSVDMALKTADRAIKECKK